MNTHMLSLPGRLSEPVKLVEVIRRNTPISESKAKRLYGAQPTRELIRGTTHDRLVFELHSGALCVIPDTPSNAPLWRPL